MKALSNVLLVLTSVGGALVFVVGAAVLPRHVHMQLPAPKVTSSMTHPEVVVVPASQGSAKSAVKEEVVLFGPASLFLPTYWTASEISPPQSARREPNANFPPTVPKYQFHGDTGAQVAIQDPFVAPESGLASLGVGIRMPPYATFGQFETLAQPIVKRTLMVEAYETKRGQLSYSQALIVEKPPLEINSDWKPMEMLVAVGTSGQVGLPAIVQGTGSDLLDGFLIGYFSRQLPITLRLSPGFYTIRIGP